MISKVIGGILLIIGTSIGAGMLALPVVTAGGGFLHSLWLFFSAWIITVFAAFLILEVNLWLPEKTNLVSMSRKTLGRTGEIITWIIYLLLLYTLLAAYSASGSNLLQTILKFMHVDLPQWLNSVLFVLILGLVIYLGIRVIDWTNRGLMIIKLGSYLLLVILVAPHMDVHKLTGGKFRLLAGALMVIITAFGYATIIPSLRTYFKSNVNALRLTIALGSIFSLLIYLVWDFVVQGTLTTYGPQGLLGMAHSGKAASDLMQALSLKLRVDHLNDLSDTFISICVTTSFLGVSLSLSDFLADGMKLAGKQQWRWLVMLATFLPPLIIVLFKPGIFIAGLNIAGILCVLLLIMLPALMAWSGRYIIKTAKGYQVWGGKIILGLEILISIALFIYGCVTVF